MAKCLSQFVRIYTSQVAGKDDRTILDDIERSSPKTKERKWYVHDLPEHRLYLRLLRQEAHHRGIT